MENHLVCCLCLAREDLIRITEEKENIINTLLHQELPKDVIHRICINCSNALMCLDKFHKNAKASQKILKEQRTSLQNQNNFIIPTATQDKIGDAFDTILNWLTGVNVDLEYHRISKGLEMSSSNKVLDQGSADVIIINSVNNNDLETIEATLENFGETDESIIESPQMKNLSHEDDDDLEKYRDSTKVNEKLQYQCSECKRFFSRIILKYHFNIHKGLTPFKCIVKGCSKAYFSPYIAQIHCKSSHKLKVSTSEWIGNENQKKPRKINDDDGLAKYRDLTKINEQRNYRCPECNKYFARNTLKYHFNVHNGVRPFKCIAKGCSKAFFSPFNAVRHCKIYHNLDVKVTEWIRPSKKWEARFASKNRRSSF